jgi:Uma2 family endonuclease
VTSPYDVLHEVHGKVREYFEHGVSEVWVVIPEEGQVYVYHWPTDVDIYDVTSTITGGEILPGFELPLGNLFRRTTAVPN